MPNAPVEGAAAPDFNMPTADGPAKLSDYSGRWLVLYFYPRDDTPGCTTEANEFGALSPDFEKAGASVLGVSRDTVAKHEKFAAKHGFSTPLASDADGAVCEAYGVWVEKNMYGRKSMGVERATFLIGPDGTIQRVWRKVKPSGHAQAVLDEIRSKT